MSIVSGYDKYKRYQKINDDEYKLVSHWTSSNTVHFDDNSTAEEKVNELNAEVAIERERINKLSIFLTPQMFGAKGDGITDDTDSFNQLITECNITGKHIFIPKGVYVVTGGLNTITSPCIIMGSGHIKGNDDTGQEYLIHTTAKTIIEGISITANGYDGAIKFDSTKLCCVNNCTVNADVNGVVIIDSSLCSVKDCYIVNAKRGIAIISENVDTGDNFFYGNTFDCSDGSGKSAIAFYSGGGIRIINNKILTYENAINIVSTGETSVLVIDGNSFENGDRCLYVNNSSSYGRIIFSNNQVTQYCILLNKNTYEVQITGNVFKGKNVENSICCTINDIQGKISFENNIVNGFKYGVYSYKDIKDLKIGNNNYDDYCTRAIAGNYAIFNETYDKIIQSTGASFYPCKITPIINGSCIVEILFSGVANNYALLKLVNNEGTITCEKLHGDDIFTCAANGTIICDDIAEGDIYAHISVKGCVNAVEIL